MTQGSDIAAADSNLFAEVSYEEWRRRVVAELAGADFATELTTRLAEGITVEPLYTASHPAAPRPWLAPAAATADGDPAIGRRWQLVQCFSEPDPRSLCQSLREDLAGGVTGIRIRLDRAARLGREPHALSERAPGDGTAIHTLGDLEQSFGAALPQARTWMLDAGGNFLPAAALLLAWRRRAAFDRDHPAWLLGADPLAALARDGRLPGTLEQLEGDLAALVRHGEAEPAETRALGISTETYREAGADAAQELGLALATATHYLRTLERRGIEPAAAARQTVFAVALGQDLFTEIAKLRALRRLWTDLLLACAVPAPPPAWVHAGVLRRALSPGDPWSNLLRITAAGFAAVVGGADSLETPAVDAGPPDSGRRRGRRLARNAQHILAAECHLGRVIDPGAGAYYLEHLTTAIARRAWEFLQSVEAAGGMLTALRSCWLHQRLGERPLPAATARAEAAPAERDPRHPRGAAPASALDGPPAPRPGGELEGPLDLAAGDGTARLQGCVEAAARGASLAQLARALYGDGDSLTVEPLAPRDADGADTDAAEETSS